MVQTRSQTRALAASYGRDWVVVASHPEVRIPARPRLQEPSAPSPVIKVKEEDEFLSTPSPSIKAEEEDEFSSTPSPAIKVKEEDEFDLLGNAPRQYHAVSKVFEATRSIFIARSALELTAGDCRWETLDCLQALGLLQETLTDFILNGCVGGWEPTMPHVKVSEAAVHAVVWELYHVARGMVREDQDVAVLEHAARWAIVLISSGGEYDATEHGEGSSELHEGLFGFVMWTLASS